MKLDLTNRYITIVIVPMDMRAGISRLQSVAMNELGIDINRGHDVVVFVSRTLSMSKMIWADEKGTCLLVRKLHRGRFERFLAKADELGTRDFTYEELCAFMDGEPLMVKRTHLYGEKTDIGFD